MWQRNPFSCLCVWFLICFLDCWPFGWLAVALLGICLWLYSKCTCVPLFVCLFVRALFFKSVCVLGVLRCCDWDFFFLSIQLKITAQQFFFSICNHFLHFISANFNTLFICGCHREQCHRVFYFFTWIFNRKFTIFLKLFWAKNQNKENPIKISSRWLTFGTIPIVSIKLGSTLMSEKLKQSCLVAKFKLKSVGISCFPAHPLALRFL